MQKVERNSSLKVLIDQVQRLKRFSRSFRLVSAADYRQVFSSNSRSSDKRFTVLARTNDGDIARLGLAIAKKHARRAVDRNRIKRLVRENFRHSMDELTGYDLVVMAKPNTAECSNLQLSNSLQAHWRQILKSH